MSSGLPWSQQFLSNQHSLWVLSSTLALAAQHSSEAQEGIYNTQRTLNYKRGIGGLDFWDDEKKF